MKAGYSWETLIDSAFDEVRCGVLNASEVQAVSRAHSFGLRDLELPPFGIKLT